VGKFQCKTMGLFCVRNAKVGSSILLRSTKKPMARLRLAF
jgi:hypothetical protein